MPTVSHAQQNRSTRSSWSALLKSGLSPRRLLSVAGPPFLTLLVFLGAWQVGATLADSATILPTPVAIWEEMTAQHSLLLEHTIATTQIVVVGFVISVALGVPLGAAVTLWPLVERIVYPFLVASQAVPKIAIAPLFVVWIGLGFAAKVFIVVTVAIFPIVIDTAVGLKSPGRDLIRMAESMNASKLQVFRKVRLPAAVPSIWGGCRVAVTLAVVGAIVAEFVGSTNGLGYLLIISLGHFDTALMFAAIVLLAVLGVVLFAAVSIAERILWRYTRPEVRGS